MLQNPADDSVEDASDKEVRKRTVLTMYFWRGGGFIYSNFLNKRWCLIGDSNM